MVKAIGIIGLGYVGLGLSIALSKSYNVLGYDISETRINELINGIDKNQQVNHNELISSSITYTNDIKKLKVLNFFIITVSTPAHFYTLPNLNPLIYATQTLGSILKKGDIIVYESTVYPGTTEEVCIPLLEKTSQLSCGIDFNVGYSPERISPNDSEHNLKNIIKIISAQNIETLHSIQDVYSKCCNTIFPVSDIKTAEAVKILENTQRDINIAFMNEFSQIMHAMNLNVHEIIKAAQTKWSFVTFKPGFVGGHCIAVDPLYLAFKAKRLGVDHDLILAARKINDNLTHFIVIELNKLLAKHNILLNNCSVGIFGITYKENTPDIRNSLALKFIKELKIAGFDCQVHDPLAEKNIVYEKYQIKLKSFKEISFISVAIIVVAHDFYRHLGIKKLVKKFSTEPIIMDIPNLFIDKIDHIKNIDYWSL